MPRARLGEAGDRRRLRSRRASASLRTSLSSAFSRTASTLRSIDSLVRRSSGGSEDGESPCAAAGRGASLLSISSDTCRHDLRRTPRARDASCDGWMPLASVRRRRHGLVESTCPCARLPHATTSRDQHPRIGRTDSPGRRAACGRLQGRECSLRRWRLRTPRACHLLPLRRTAM